MSNLTIIEEPNEEIKNYLCCEGIVLTNNIIGDLVNFFICIYLC